MEKKFREEELKELEAEIDSAVDRLFVARKGTAIEPLLQESPRLEPSTQSTTGLAAEASPSFDPMESSILELSSEIEKSMGAMEEPTPQREEPPKLEPEIIPSLVPPLSKPPEPPAQPKSLEKLESQLLSLEWEITKENLEKTRREIHGLQEAFGGESNVSSILAFMERVLSRMVNEGETISPPLMKFLMDSKETIKLFLKKETNEEMDLYWGLAYEGIRARFSGLEISSPSLRPTEPLGPLERVRVDQAASAGPKMVEDLSNALSGYFGKVDERFKKIDQHLSGLNDWIRNASEELMQRRLASTPATRVIVFEVNDHYFGVPSEKVFKLFKVPASLQDRFMNQQKIRLREFELKIVDLQVLLSLPKKKSQEERRILIVRDDGEYKGFLIHNVLDRVSAHPAAPRELGTYASGVMQWTYQQQPMDVPILNVSKL